jgi:hypothetical protein
MDIPDRREMTVDELLDRYRSGERDFSNTELPDGVSLRGVVLAGAVFDDGWFDGIDFTSAALSGASFQRVRLIQFGGHLPNGGYDVQTDGRDPQAPAAPAIRR